MSIVGLIVLIVVVGFLLWWVETYVPMNPSVKRLLEGIVILVLVLTVLWAFGLLPLGASTRVPSLR